MQKTIAMLVCFGAMACGVRADESALVSKPVAVQSAVVEASVVDKYIIEPVKKALQKGREVVDHVWCSLKTALASKDVSSKEVSAPIAPAEEAAQSA